MNKVKKILKLIFNIFLIFILVTVIILIKSKFIDKDRVPNAYGYSVLRVVSGSMQPTIKVGSIIIIKREDDYKVNDIVTKYENNSLITHRIKELTKDKVITKGDSNNIEDEPSDKNNIVGKVVFISNLLGFLLYFISKPINLILIFIVGMIIMILIPDKKKRR